jgi:CRP-like cAMP-binding protein
MEVARFHQHLERQLPGWNDEDLAELTAAFSLRRIKKRQLIVQPGFPADYRIYVVQGAFRAYVVDPAGAEHTIQFAIEDWWITDVNSYLFRTPAQMFVVALEDSTVFEVDYATEQRLMQTNRRFETLFRLQAERAAAYHQRRLVSALTRTAEERYEEFMATYPTVFQRLPQYVIASYLGMSKEFLSKIRSRGARKKAN